jgi:hypothetical protein
MASMIKGMVYKITSPNTDMVYIGSTTETLNDRLRKHIYDMKKTNNYVSSQIILEKGSVNIELLEEVYVDSIRDLRKIEQEYIDKTHNAVNKIRAFDVNPKESHKKHCTKYNERNREFRNKSFRDKKHYCKLCDCTITGYGMLARHERTIKHIRNFILS